MGMNASGSKVFAGTELTFSNWIKEVKIGGDYRLRYDNQNFRDADNDGGQLRGDKYRERFRMRWRIGADVSLLYNVGAKFRLASGSGEQISTNQTFTGNNSQKNIWIDLANVYLKPGKNLKAGAGKIENPLWILPASDLNWDPDYNPEGAGENFNYSLGSRGNLFVNALQISVNENRQGPDQWEFSEQAGVDVPLPFGNHFKVAYAYHDWKNLKFSSMSVSPATLQEGNSYTTTGMLANDFGISELQGELSGWIGKLPLSFQGTFIKNRRAQANSLGEKRNMGYHLGVILGEAKEAHSWEFAYFYKWLEGDATPADVADSDFGDGGTNRYGHILWAAYSPTGWLYFRTKYWLTKNIDNTLPFGNGINNTRKGSISRLFIDAIVKF